MDKNDILNAIEILKKGKKKKFNQSYDLIINLKGLNLKKPEEKVDSFVVLPYARKKVIKVCAFVDESMVKEAEVCDKIILEKDFVKYAKDKKLLKKTAKEYYYFIAQGAIMPKVAASFGKFLGPRGKMPNPKLGCVIMPKTSIKSMLERLKKTVKLQTKNEKIVKCTVGDEQMSENEIAENIEAVYNGILRVLPNETGNIRNVLLKLTMSPSVLISGEEKKEKDKGEEKRKGKFVGNKRRNTEKPMKKTTENENKELVIEKTQESEEEGIVTKEKKENKLKSKPGKETEEKEDTEEKK